MIAAALSSLVWGGFTYLGFGLTRGVEQQHAPGYPNSGQWHYYVHLPLIMALISVGLLLFARKIPMVLFLTVWIVQTLAFFPFFLGYTGGV